MRVCNHAGPGRKCYGSKKERGVGRRGVPASPVRAIRSPGQPEGISPARCHGRFRPRQFARRRRRARRLKRPFGLPHETDRIPAGPVSRSPWQSTLMPNPAYTPPRRSCHRHEPWRTEGRMLRGTTLFPAPRPKTPRKTSPEGRPSAETPDPSAARAPRGPPHLGASAQRRHDRVKVNTAPRMPTVRSGSKPEGAIRQLPPGTGRREPTTPRLRPGTQNGTSPAFVPPSGSAPRPDPRSISA